MLYALCAITGGCAQQQLGPTPADPLIAIGISERNILVRLQLRAAPLTSCNFLRYALGGHYDGGRFFRAVRSEEPGGNAVPIDVVQAEAREGEELNVFGPIPLERTSVTGLTHEAGALSMARWGPDTATSSFSIVVKPSPGMNSGGSRNPDRQGFAVFGRVIEGMDVVRAVHRRPTREERFVQPVLINRVQVQPHTPKEGAALGDYCKAKGMPLPR